MTGSECFIDKMEANVVLALAVRGVTRLYICFFMALEAFDDGRIGRAQLPRLRELIRRVDRGLLDRGERPLTPDELGDLRLVLDDYSSIPPMFLSAEHRGIAECLVTMGVLERTTDRLIPNGEYRGVDEPLFAEMPWAEYTYTVRTRWTFMRNWWQQASSLH